MIAELRCRHGRLILIIMGKRYLHHMLAQKMRRILRRLAGLLAVLFAVGAIVSFFTGVLPRPQDMKTWTLVALGVPLVLYFLIEFISPFAEMSTWASKEKHSSSKPRRDADGVDAGRGRTKVAAMNPIDSESLIDALEDIGIPCDPVELPTITSVSELSKALGLILSDDRLEVLVPDPFGRFDYGFFMQSKIAFESGSLLFSEKSVLVFGDNGGGWILFVSDYMKGKVGILHSPPEDISKFPYHETASKDVRYSEYEFLEWLRQFKIQGVSLIDD